MRFSTVVAILLATTSVALAQHSRPASPRQVPPAGIEIPASDRAELESGVAALAQEIARARRTGNAGERPHGLLADVEIFHKAVHDALTYNEFFDRKQIATAKALLQVGMEREAAVRESKAPWASAPGLVVRGYVSKIDHSVQPYGLVIPETWSGNERSPWPLWVWLHGRNEKLTELAFLEERMKKGGEFTPADAIVLHVYGRFCNANKLAGEVDVFEALADVRTRYLIDPDRMIVAGFSMGGAACWHVAGHHAGMWAGASPGAGFAETAEYAKVFAPGKQPPPWWEQVLWRWYDATAWAANLSNVPLIAYSGELDKQQQAADIMEKAMAAEGLELERLTGPNTGHKYEAKTKAVLSERLREFHRRGREPMPPTVRFTTYTLRYPTMEWVTIHGLEKHWERADIDAELVDEGTIRVKTKNVSAFTIALPVAPAPLDKTRPPRVVVDEQDLVGPPVADYWTAHFQKTAGVWKQGRLDAGDSLIKRHGSTGPIDDAFMDSFIFVRPTGKALYASIEKWAGDELQRARTQWRTVFRGEARMKDDTAITAADIADANLILWGDPGSNSVLAKILPSLPIQWTAESLVVAGEKYSAEHHAPVLIFPNPLNHGRYVVLNSSFTFRAGSAVSNALQTPKLPDWAVIDLRTPPDLSAPGLVVNAGFFNEQWQWATPDAH